MVEDQARWSETDLQATELALAEPLHRLAPLGFSAALVGHLAGEARFPSKAAVLAHAGCDLVLFLCAESRWCRTHRVGREPT